MERGVIIGALLISASLLVAVLLLNRSALEERTPPAAAEPYRESTCPKVRPAAEHGELAESAEAQCEEADITSAQQASGESARPAPE